MVIDLEDLKSEKTMKMTCVAIENKAMTTGLMYAVLWQITKKEAKMTSSRRYRRRIMTNSCLKQKIESKRKHFWIKYSKVLTMITKNVWMSKKINLKMILLKNLGRALGLKIMIMMMKTGVKVKLVEIL